MGQRDEYNILGGVAIAGVYFDELGIQHAVFQHVTLLRCEFRYNQARGAKYGCAMHTPVENASSRSKVQIDTQPSEVPVIMNAPLKVCSSVIDLVCA